MTNRRVPAYAIQRATAEHYRIPVRHLFAPHGKGERTKERVGPRQMSMYLTWTLNRHLHDGSYRYSTTVVGKLHGNRDHTTVMHAIRKIEREWQTDPELRRDAGKIAWRARRAFAAERAAA